MSAHALDQEATIADVESPYRDTDTNRSLRVADGSCDERRLSDFEVTATYPLDEAVDEDELPTVIAPAQTDDEFDTVVPTLRAVAEAGHRAPAAELSVQSGEFDSSGVFTQVSDAPPPMTLVAPVGSDYSDDPYADAPQSLIADVDAMLEAQRRVSGFVPSQQKIAYHATVSSSPVVAVRRQGIVARAIDRAKESVAGWLSGVSNLVASSRVYRLLSAGTCYHCKSRLTMHERTLALPHVADSTISVRLHSNDWAYFRALGPARRHEGHLQLTLCSCGHCGHTNRLDIIRRQGLGTRILASQLNLRHLDASTVLAFPHSDD